MSIKNPFSSFLPQKNQPADPQQPQQTHPAQQRQFTDQQNTQTSTPENRFFGSAFPAQPIQQAQHTAQQTQKPAQPTQFSPKPSHQPLPQQQSQHQSQPFQPHSAPKASLRIIPLGGIGNVTKNMYVYEYGDEILIVDCGMGFPEDDMHGVDILLPDVSYIQKRIQQGAQIAGLVLTHAHDDHIAALPYILPMLTQDFPLYGSPLTAAFAVARMEDMKVHREVLTYPAGRLQLGSFSIETIPVTHSVPDARHLVIRTPAGIVYHGSDFKLDMHPIDGKRTDLQAIARVGQEGILCALLDCLRVERDNWSPSESSVRDNLVREFRDVQGKILVTLMSSNIHRIQQVIDTAVEFGRKVVFVGRSVENNVNVAGELGMLKIPKQTIINKKYINDTADEKLCVVIAGSQGQPGSSLVRAVSGEHPIISITPKKDRVVFASEPIPGNESNVYWAVDTLARNGVEVKYSDVDEGLHVSGHASKIEQQVMISLLGAKYLFPIGGTDRHRVLFGKVAQSMGYAESNVLLPKSGQVMITDGARIIPGETLNLREIIVDGLGVGDVGNIVLAERKQMADEGMLVVVLPSLGAHFDASEIHLVSRGFVFMRESEELMDDLRLLIAETISNARKERKSDEIVRLIEKKVGEFCYKRLQRRPLVVVEGV